MAGVQQHRWCAIGPNHSRVLAGVARLPGDQQTLAARAAFLRASPARIEHAQLSALYCCCVSSLMTGLTVQQLPQGAQVGPSLQHAAIVAEAAQLHDAYAGPYMIDGNLDEMGAVQTLCQGGQVEEGVNGIIGFTGHFMLSHSSLMSADELGTITSRLSRNKRVQQEKFADGMALLQQLEQQASEAYSQRNYATQEPVLEPLGLGTLQQMVLMAELEPGGRAIFTIHSEGHVRLLVVDTSRGPGRYTAELIDSFGAYVSIKGAETQHGRLRHITTQGNIVVVQLVEDFRDLSSPVASSSSSSSGKVGSSTYQGPLVEQLLEMLTCMIFPNSLEKVKAMLTNYLSSKLDRRFKKSQEVIYNPDSPTVQELISNWPSLGVVLLTPQVTGLLDAAGDSMYNTLEKWWAPQTDLKTRLKGHMDFMFWPQLQQDFCIPQEPTTADPAAKGQPAHGSTGLQTAAGEVLEPAAEQGEVTVQLDITPRSNPCSSLPGSARATKVHADQASRPASPMIGQLQVTTSPLVGSHPVTAAAAEGDLPADSTATATSSRSQRGGGNRSRSCSPAGRSVAPVTTKAHALAVRAAGAAGPGSKDSLSSSAGSDAAAPAPATANSTTAAASPCAQGQRPLSRLSRGRPAAAEFKESGKGADMSKRSLPQAAAVGGLSAADAATLGELLGSEPGVSAAGAGAALQRLWGTLSSKLRGLLRCLVKQAKAGGKAVVKLLKTVQKHLEKVFQVLGVGSGNGPSRQLLSCS